MSRHLPSSGPWSPECARGGALLPPGWDKLRGSTRHVPDPEFPRNLEAAEEKARPRGHVSFSKPCCVRPQPNNYLVSTYCVPGQRSTMLRHTHVDI